MHSQLEAGSRAKLPDQLHWGANLVDGRDLKDSRIPQIYDSLILVFLQQSVKHRSRLRSVLSEDIPLPYTFRTFLPR